MADLIERVKCKIVITLNDENNTEIDISLSTVENKNNITNYVTSIDIDESTNAQNNNPVGVVSANTLKIVLNSNDRSLFPENNQSPYYGFMNNTATIRVTLTDVDGEVNFNTYYISKWNSNINSNNPNQVIIEATDLLAIINKNSVPSGTITNRDMTTKESFIFMLNNLNNNLDLKYKLQYDESDINFSDFDKIEYDNIEAGNMSDWLNTVSQCTLTNIYIARDNKLKTDNCLDDKATESVGTLSDKVNITNASVDTGGLVNYTGVKINYITNTINPMTELTTVSNQLVKPGVNVFDDIDLSNKVFTINAVRLISNTSQALKLTKLVYDKRKCNIEIENITTENITCSIVIYGQSFKENKLSVLKTKGSTNEILEVTNKLLLPNYADKYANNLLKLVGLKNSSLSLTGFFNPRLKLGDTIYVDVDKSIKTSGYYKIIGLHWKISNTIKCTAKVIKVIV